MTFTKGDTFKNKGDDYTTYTIDCPKTSKAEFSRPDPTKRHYSMIHVFGDEALRDKIIDLLNKEHRNDR